MAAYLDSMAQGRNGAARFRDYLDSVKLPGRYMDSPRHLCEVEHFAYQQTFERGLRILNKP